MILLLHTFPDFSDRISRSRRVGYESGEFEIVSSLSHLNTLNPSRTNIRMFVLVSSFWCPYVILLTLRTTSHHNNLYI